MKKQILLLASIIVSTIAIAQVNPSFGIRAGATSSRMQGDAMKSFENLLEFTNGMISTESRTGFFAGANANIPLSDVMSLEPGLYYSQKGYQLKGALNLKGVEFLVANAKVQLNTDYVDLPVVLKAKLGGFQIFAGPQVSYLTKADLRTTAGALGFNVVNSKMDVSEQFNRWDAGVTGGVGYKFINGFSVTAAYDHGLTKADANRNLESYNRSFKVGVGLNF